MNKFLSLRISHKNFPQYFPTAFPAEFLEPFPKAGILDLVCVNPSFVNKVI